MGDSTSSNFGNRMNNADCRFPFSKSSIAQPMVRHNKTARFNFLEMCKLIDGGSYILTSSELDIIYNPLCHGRPRYDQVTRATLYYLPPARTAGMMAYSFPNKPIPNIVRSVEILHSGQKLIHQLDIPPTVMDQIIEKNKISCSDNYMLYIPHAAFEINSNSIGELYAEIIDGNAVTVLKTKAKSGWHGLHPEVNLPYDDGKPRNGHNGFDRYLWKLGDKELRHLGGNGYLGSAVYLYYWPFSYGQNVVVAFGPTMLLMLWEILLPSKANAKI